MDELMRTSHTSHATLHATIKVSEVSSARSFTWSGAPSRMCRSTMRMVTAWANNETTRKKSKKGDNKEINSKLT